jgi:hypothetical protein
MLHVGELHAGGHAGVVERGEPRQEATQKFDGDGISRLRTPQQLFRVAAEGIEGVLVAARVGRVVFGHATISVMPGPHGGARSS